MEYDFFNYSIEELNANIFPETSLEAKICLEHMMQHIMRSHPKNLEDLTMLQDLTLGLAHNCWRIVLVQIEIEKNKAELLKGGLEKLSTF